MPALCISLLNAFLLSVVMIQALGAGAGRIGLIDVPRGRKAHEGAVPLTGGIAMFTAFLIPVLTLHFASDVPWSLILGLLILVALGAVDDIIDIRPRTKLCGQILAVMIMVLAEGRLVGPGALFGSSQPVVAWAAVAFTLCLMVGMINAFNMIDGLDGLAGGMAAVALFWIIMAGLAGPAGAVLIEPVLILFAVLGFLVFNLRHPWRRQASVFMGDAGSMMLGGAVAFFVVDLASSGAPVHVPLPALLWFVALPVFDTLILIGRRIAAGQSPLVGDRRHLHHLLLEAGLPSGQATGILIAVAAVLGGCGFLGWRLGQAPEVLLAGLAVPFALHLYFVCAGWKLLGQLLATPAPSAPVVEFPLPKPSSVRPIDAFPRVELDETA